MVGMAHDRSPRESCFGYISTLHSAEHGYFGGLLLVNAAGRPLEFHCTCPVKPSRAQEILYGPTLATYLLGEEIGGALFQAAKLAPRMILVDQLELLALRQRANVPVALVMAPGYSAPCGLTSIDRSASGGSEPVFPPLPVLRFTVDSHTLQLPAGFESDRDVVNELIATLAQQVELAEPFGRIHEAIREAQRLGERPPEAYGHAA
jgi:hypothetical protein